MIKDPRPHQQKAIDSVVKELNINHKAQAVMACGTGKTLTSLWIKEELKSNKTLVLLPSISLLAQFASEWKDNKNQDFISLAVCSDNTVIDNTDNNIKTNIKTNIDKDFNSSDNYFNNDFNNNFNDNLDDIDLLKVNLQEQVTNDYLVIAEFLESDIDSVIFSTYQSSDLIVAAQELSEVYFSLAIADEAHKTTGSKDSYYKNILDDNKILADNKLFCTATPKIYSSNLKDQIKEKSNKKKAINNNINNNTVNNMAIDDANIINNNITINNAITEGIDNEADNNIIASMDNHDIFGRVAYSYPFSKAIEDDILCDYEVLITSVSEYDKDYRNIIKNMESELGYQIQDYSSVLKMISLLKSACEFDLSKVITFHNRIQAATDFSGDEINKGYINYIFEELKAQGQIEFDKTLWSSAINGTMPSKERKELLDYLAQGPESLKVISNARCLTEGVDVPSLDSIIFINPKESQVDIIQAIGRVLRKAPGKEKGYIIVPLVIDNFNSLEEELLSEHEFESIINVLTALKAHDQDLDIMLNKLSPDNNSSSQDITPQKIVFTDSFKQLLDNDVYEKINIEIMEAAMSPWFKAYNKLKEYINKYNKMPSSNEVYKDFNLGKWVSKQKVAYNDEILNETEIRLLSQLPEWTWIINKDFEINYKLTCQYLLKNKALPKAESRMLYNNSKKQIGKWLIKQNLNYQKYLDNKDNGNLENKFENKSEMPLAEVEACQYLREYNSWLVAYYKTKHYTSNHYITPQDDMVYQYFDIGQWCDKQRALYHNQELDEIKISLLEELDWNWKPKDLNQEWIELLKDYIKQHNCLPGQKDLGFSTVYKTEHLGQWIKELTTKYLDNSLDNNLLDYLNNSSYLNSDSLDNNLEETLEETLEENRQDDLNNNSNESLQNSLEDSFNENSKNNSKNNLKWNWGFYTNRLWWHNYYIFYHYLEEHKLMPKNNVIYQELNLNKWLKIQIQAYKNKELNNEQIQALANFKSYYDIDKDWLNLYNLSLAYVKNFHKLPEMSLRYNEIELGTWFNSQLVKYQADNLNKEKQIKFQELLDCL